MTTLAHVSQKTIQANRRPTLKSSSSVSETCFGGSYGEERNLSQSDNVSGNRCRREMSYVTNQRSSATPVDRIVRHHLEVTNVVEQ